MLLESTIDRVMGGVKKCHRRLTIHGATVVLDDLITANTPFTPSAPPEARTPEGALKQDAPGPKSPAPPSSPSSQSSSSEASEVSSEASAPWSVQSSSTSPSCSSVFQPHVVALHWRGYPPRDIFGRCLLELLTVSGVSSNNDFTFLHIVDRKEVVTQRKNAGEGPRLSTPVDLVAWHHPDHVLELQADTVFTTTGVLNALARETSLSGARGMLLEYVDRNIRWETSNEDYSRPLAADDPAVIQFMARFKANLVELIKEASAAPAAFSVSHSLLPDGVEGQLRENVALNRRKHAAWEEYERLSKDYQAAVEARKKSTAGGEGAPASPAPAGDIPDKPVFRRNDEPMSPDALASAPPVVLRPMEDLFRVFTDAEIMVVFSKVILSRDDCVLCPGFKLWFEKKRVVKNDGVVRHEYDYKTGSPYC